jgi:DNA-binding MarR family transcriptional regulator
MLNRLVTSVYDKALRPLGLKASQLNVLVAAGKMGLAPPTRVCKVLHLDPSTLSRNVERMIAQGWLEVVPGEDARMQPFRLTAEGRALLERAFPLWTKAQQRATTALGAAGVEALRGAVQRMSRTSIEPGRRGKHHRST